MEPALSLGLYFLGSIFLKGSVMTMEKFHYKLPDGHEIVLPKMENVKTGIMRKTRKLAPLDQVFTMLEALLTEEDLAHTDDMDREEFNDLMEAWRADSSVSVGESSAS